MKSLRWSLSFPRLLHHHKKNQIEITPTLEKEWTKLAGRLGVGRRRWCLSRLSRYGKDYERERYGWRRFFLFFLSESFLMINCHSCYALINWVTGVRLSIILLFFLPGLPPVFLHLFTLFSLFFIAVMSPWSLFFPFFSFALSFLLFSRAAVSRFWFARTFIAEFPKAKKRSSTMEWVK